MPALPGAHHNSVTRGDRASFHTRACSRPPDPMTKSFIETRIEAGNQAIRKRFFSRSARADSRSSSRRGKEADFAIKPLPPRYRGGYGVSTPGLRPEGRESQRDSVPKPRAPEYQPPSLILPQTSSTP